MELADLIGLRPLPGAGLLLTLTRRCPLACAHCSTASTMRGEEPDSGRLLRFVASFTDDNRPDVVMLTGGEPLLLPELAQRLASRAREAGSRTALLSGMFFARQRRIPARIMGAITAVDHFSASLDVHHEREVPRSDVFQAVRRILDSGVTASFHITGSGPDDPYLAEVTDEVRHVFGDQVPMLVTEVRPMGRAAAWAARPRPPVDPDRVLPCSAAAWPVVAFDGTVVACCNQDVVDRRPVPDHLRLGHIAEDDWRAVRQRVLSSPVLRMVRVAGPVRMKARYGRERTTAPCQGYCGTCRSLGDEPAVIEAVSRVASGPVGELLDREAARVQVQDGPVALVRRHGSAPYADLVVSAERSPERGSSEGDVRCAGKHLGGRIAR
ncbi:radical SAM protein [Wenjunlia tyrosinilytica]|uniref:Radical SAM core domain-containing protein n=1 Tax=Wenjunlia tyrosinilytica TaxID=1544741 RepID=A0A917ZXR6_9ACTN|nr:radical SAM protein [Wenjunlia tyrosinilytica]GGP00005.1 hypothetical protein GCM10012280_67740 [Wenjunlia tyrosinilytica]